MKAIDIINFINEDKFSKYTLDQIFDELGGIEEFMEYLETVCTKVVRSLKTDTEIKNAKPKITFNKFGEFWVLGYYSTTGNLREEIMISTAGHLSVSYNIIGGLRDYVDIEISAVNIGAILSAAIVGLYKMSKAKKERAKILGRK